MSISDSVKQLVRRGINVLVSFVVVVGASSAQTQKSPLTLKWIFGLEGRGVASVIALSCVLFLCSTGASGQKIAASSSRIMEELAGLENDWLATYVSGDRAKYDQIVAEDFTGIDESATLRNKADDRALVPAEKVPEGSAANEDMHVRVYGNVAVVTGRIVTRFIANGREIASFKTRFTDTWAKREGSWKVIARHYSRYPPERKAIDIDPLMVSELAGKYEIAPAVIYEVSVENRKLFGAAAGQPRLELLPESEFVFFTRSPAAIYVFTRDRAGKIGHLLFIQDGRVIPAKRL
jgi:hypothetical protein